MKIINLGLDGDSLVVYNDEAVTSRGRAVVARQAHNLEVVGSSPTPATMLCAAG